MSAVRHFAMARIVVVGERTEYRRVFFQRGVWAITALEEDVTAGCTVTHLPTGTCVSKAPYSIGACKRLLDALCAVDRDWQADASPVFSRAKIARFGLLARRAGLGAAFERWKLGEQEV